MAIPLPIETERLVIRVFDPDVDADLVGRVYCDPEVMRYVPGGPLVGVDAVRDLLGRWTRDHRERGFGVWAVVERETGRPIGDVGFGVFSQTDDVELGWTVARDRWGRGFATEAAAACLAAGLAHLDVPRIVAVVEVANDRSIRVAERIGMARVEDIVAYGRPHVLFAAMR